MKPPVGAVMVTLALCSLGRAFATGGDALNTPAVTIGDSLDFLPGKSLGEIFLETKATPADDQSSDLGSEILQIAERLRAESPAQLLPPIDDLLSRARQHYASKGDWCNLLHDVRDVLAGSASDKSAAAGYIEWRVENKDLFFAAPKEGQTSTNTDLEKRANETTGPLKAHWMYLCGALTYKKGDRDQCRRWFQRVAKEFPKHPRAEIALFMDARCAFSDTRKNVGQDEEAPPDADMIAARKQATELFESYRKRYPHGRFVADALGWLGALAFDSESYLGALDCYIAQAEMPGHPETLKSAIFMCERSLAAVAAAPDGDAAFALVARHPRIAMGFTYLILSAREADNYNGKFDLPADVKKWRRTILPRIAAAVARQKSRYQSGDWQPRYLALLAQAASANGNQEQALQLTNLAPAEWEQSDDLLLVRAIAFQRADKAVEAIETYRKLLARFPSLPIAPGVRLRLAFALQDDHQAGGALVELAHLMPKRSNNPEDEGKATFAFENSPYTGAQEYPESEANWSLRESAVYPNVTGANLDQVRQAIDTLLNFAPLTELATSLSGSDFDDESKKELRAVIAQRYLAQENFIEAKKLMPPEQFKLVAEKLEQLTAAAAAARDSEKAMAMVRLGDGWSDARGKLLRAPLDTHLDLLQQPFVPQATNRRRDGRSLQFKEVDNELEQRDELRHAARWWLAAARAQPGTALAAQARWKALETMPKVARDSEYAEERAREIKGEGVSREIYNRLRTECPDSIEAKRLAAYWSFPSEKKEEDQEYDAEFKLRDARIMGYRFTDNGVFDSAPNEQSSQDIGIDPGLLKRVALLLPAAQSGDLPQFAAEARNLDAAVRSKVSSISDAPVTNFLDDLVQFCAEAKVTSEMLKTYVPIRFMILQSNGWDEPDQHEALAVNDDEIRAKIDEALANPTMEAVADYLEFCRIGLISGDRTELETDIIDPKDDGAKVTLKTRDYAAMEKLARQFLKKYPRSRKREAALFVLARSVQALSRPQLCEIGVPAPGTTVANEVFDVVEKSYQAEPFDRKRVLAALDDYDRAFPSGRYAGDVRNLRAMTLWRIHDWGKALDLTTAQLADNSKQDLQPEAAVRLANIFANLEQPEDRADLLEAIRARPIAIKYLTSYLARASKDRQHPLRYLQAYVRDQLNSKSVMPRE